MAQIINPGDSMSYRKGTVFLMFHQENITVKIFNGEMKTISWEQFFAYTQEIFAEAAAGNRTYENYFGIPEETPAMKPEQTQPEAATEYTVRPETEIVHTQKSEQVENVENSVDNHVEGQKQHLRKKKNQYWKTCQSDSTLETPESHSENTEKSQETALPEPEPQIPGQDSIETIRNICQDL